MFQHFHFGQGPVKTCVLNGLERKPCKIQKQNRLPCLVLVVVVIVVVVVVVVVVVLVLVLVLIVVLLLQFIIVCLLLRLLFLLHFVSSISS